MLTPAIRRGRPLGRDDRQFDGPVSRPAAPSKVMADPACAGGAVDTDYRPARFTLLPGRHRRFWDGWYGRPPG
jgi:hypothetical protein